MNNFFLHQRQIIGKHVEDRLFRKERKRYFLNEGFGGISKQNHGQIPPKSPVGLEKKERKGIFCF